MKKINIYLLIAIIGICFLFIYKLCIFHHEFKNESTSKILINTSCIKENVKNINLNNIKKSHNSFFYNNGRCINGIKIRGKYSYCDCYIGWEGKYCDINKNLEKESIKGAIVILMYKKSYIFNYTVECIKMLDKYYRKYYPTDIIIFHSNNFNNKKYIDILNKFNNITLININMTVPNKWRGVFTDNWKNSSCSSRYDINYLNMIRFFSKTIFLYENIQKYDYIWRIDADIFLRRTIPCNIFKVMYHSKSLFGFISWKKTESKKCMGNIREITYDYAKINKFSPVYLDNLVATHMSAGWTVFKTSFWKSKTYQDFMNIIDDSGIQYYNRTGEQVIYAHALALLTPTYASHQFSSFGPVFHKSRKYAMLWGNGVPNEKNQNLINGYTLECYKAYYNNFNYINTNISLFDVANKEYNLIKNISCIKNCDINR